MRWPSPRTLITAGVGVLALAAVTLGLWLWMASREHQAAAAYADPLARLAAARPGPLGPEASAAIASDLEAALARYPSASLAAEAAWELGNLRYTDRDWARARSAWLIVLARSQSPTLRTQARASIGYAWEAEGNLAEARAVYAQTLAGLRPGEFGFEEVLMAQARIEERRGERAAAIESYRRLLREAPGSLRADDVRSRLASLGATP
jgi:tetratricopeptide (TPR) repeat protein